MNPERGFKSVDKLIHHMNKYYPNYKLRYSTPSDYFKALKKVTDLENIEWPVKYDDSFPISQEKGDYWTGYYSSRPNLKRAIRVASS